MHQALGDVSKAFRRDGDQALCSKWRRSLFVVKDMKKGEAFVKGVNVRSIRPGGGLHTRYWDQVLDSKAASDIEAGTALQWKLIA